MGRQIQRTYLQNQIVEYIFFESQNTYNFKLGIIAKKKGIYAIGIGNAANVYTENDPCRKASFLFKLINTNNHYCPTKININPAVTPFAIGLQPKNSMFQFQG